MKHLDLNWLLLLVCALCLNINLLPAVEGSDFFHHFGGNPGGNPFQQRKASSRFQASGGGDETYYNLLGIDRACTKSEITKAYRKKAMIMHPDKGGDEEEFKSLVEAYEILSDKNKKEHYDRFGKDEDGLNSQQSSYESNRAADLARELFRGFGGGNGFGGAFNIPLVFQLDLSLEDFFKGRDLVIPINNARVSVMVQPGMKNGQELMLKGQFRDERGVGRDVIFRLRELKHPKFQRRNGDLLTDITISLREALFGFQKTIVHLDGKEIKVFSKEGDITQFNDCFIIQGQGMPTFQGQLGNAKQSKGRLFIRATIDMPKNLNLRDAKDLEDFERLFSILESNGNKKKFVSPLNRMRSDKSKSDENSTNGAGSTTTTNSEEQQTAPPTASPKRKRNSKDPNQFNLTKTSISQFGQYGKSVGDEDDEDDNFMNFF